MSDFPITARNKVKRLHERAAYDRETVYAVLDAQPVVQVAYVIDGEPYLTPTLAWRQGDRIFWHGSSASRFLRQAVGARVCLSASLTDGYVLARSAFNHTVNYRSATVFGVAQALKDNAEKTAALKAMMDGLLPGRWPTLRPLTAQELKATTVLWMDIETASAKTRALPPGDSDEADFDVWAGVLPIETRLLAPVADPSLKDGVPIPPELLELARLGRQFRSR
jgi:nitroimidazol reductase NimA-like FMN-containing flavoprotein (pyridoxamine 5'-phosphate oxidase superfamily)